MARVTVEDCLVHAPNRFALIHLAAKRALQLKRDAEPLVDRVENKEIVTSLREIAEHAGMSYAGVAWLTKETKEDDQ